MITHYKVDGYENLQQLLKVLDGKGRLFLYFCGSPSPAGESWSAACNQSFPVVEKILKENEDRTFHFVQVGVGPLEEWIDPKCPFRMDEKIKLCEVPTLLLWRGKGRLSGKQCQDEKRVKMLNNLNGCNTAIFRRVGVSRIVTASGCFYTMISFKLRMVNHHKVEGYEEFEKILERLKGEKVVCFFSGSSDEDGESWCPDCKEAEPIVQEVLKENEHKLFNFVHVAVGSREEWKNPSCPFRTDPKIKLTSVPTLLLWGSVERLNDSECQDRENVRMVFEELK